MLNEVGQEPGNTTVVNRSSVRRGASWLYRALTGRKAGISHLWRPANEARALTPSSDIADIFFSHNGRPINKWVHYLELYDHYFSRFRNTPVRMLEIGVFEGGSLELWRQYLGADAIIYGIDIDPRCAAKVDAPNHVRIGSQANPDFLRSVVAEMGGVDLILDDGSHKGSHIITSFRTLFPLLAENGLYAIEDMHDDYSEWPGTRYNQSLHLIKRLIDDMHLNFTGLAPSENAAVGGLHIFNSITFIEKRTGQVTCNTVVP